MEDIQTALLMLIYNSMTKYDKTLDHNMNNVIKILNESKNDFIPRENDHYYCVFVIPVNYWDLDGSDIFRKLIMI